VGVPFGNPDGRFEGSVDKISFGSSDGFLFEKVGKVDGTDDGIRVGSKIEVALGKSEGMSLGKVGLDSKDSKLGIKFGEVEGTINSLEITFDVDGILDEVILGT